MIDILNKLARGAEIVLETVSMENIFQNHGMNSKNIVLKISGKLL